MSDDNIKYEKVLDLLRKSKPVFTEAEEITTKVIRQIQQEKSRISLPELIIEFLFGWVYIGWIRRSLVTAALIIVIFFGYQQALILKRLNDLSEQRIPNSGVVLTDLTDKLTERMLFNRLGGKRPSDRKINVSEKDIDDMIRSLNKLQNKYKNLLHLIENDPELKKYFDKRINEIRDN
jgi:predicted DNA-binding protein YlxM (UPF0122 family)